MEHTTWLVSLVSTASGCCKNALGKGSASSQPITNLSNILFFRYLWKQHKYNPSYRHRQLMNGSISIENFVGFCGFPPRKPILPIYIILLTWEEPV
jgi:hypothetical protein